jgi:tetratricopeptide (TPR) repeat protein
LIRVSDQTHLWAKNYDRDLNNLLDIENELGKTIAQQVQVNLGTKWQGDTAKARSADPEAYDLYLKGRYYWNQRTPPGIKQSVGYYQQAIAKDPDFAQAYAGLAAAYNFANIIGSLPEQESFPKAKDAALRAISLDPLNAEAHAALGMEKSLYEHDFAGAQEEFVKAIESNPNAAYAHLFYANCYLAPVGRMQEAVAETKRALELDPLSLPINNFMAVTYMGAGDYEASYRQFQHTIAMDPTFPLAHGYFSNLLVEMGRYEEAIQEWQKGKVLGGEEEVAAQAPGMLAAYKRGGAKAFWQLRLAEKLEARKHPGAMPVSATEIAEIYARLDDKEKAFEWLNRAVDERDGQDVIDLKCDPVYKPLRGDPRYVALLQKMGLPE